MKYKLIGVPLKYGCNIDGADKGIEIISKHINFDYIIDIPSFKEENNPKAHNILKISEVCEDLAKIVDKTIKEGFIPITIGGDHSLAIGTIAGSSNNYDISLLWIDTHTDINTDETTLTGNVHGFPVAVSIGLGNEMLVNTYSKGNKIEKEDVILFGTNDIDEAEHKIIKDNNILNYLYKDIHNNLDKYLDEVFNKLKDKKIHLSFDLDCINPNYFEAVSVPNRFNNGFTIDEINKILDCFLKLNIVSIDIVEYNPYNDNNDKCLNILLNIIEKILK